MALQKNNNTSKIDQLQSDRSDAYRAYVANPSNDNHYNLQKSNVRLQIEQLLEIGLPAGLYV